MNLSGKKEERMDTGCAPPYNNRIEPTARARHVGCLRNRRAGSAPALLLRRRASAPCSRLIRALYGRNKNSGMNIAAYAEVIRTN